MNKINLPPLNWFLQNQGGQTITNTYSGSLGTDGKTGCLSVRTFNFRAYAYVNAEGKNRLVVLTHIVEPWFFDPGVTDGRIADFDATDEGVAEAQNWLCDTAANLGF